MATENERKAKVLGRVLLLRPGLLERTRHQFSPAEPDVQPRLEAVVRSFASGYNGALTRSPEDLDLTRFPPALRGFAAEGAAMSSALVDLLTCSGGRRLRGLEHVHGAGYIHLIHVGAGWAFARLRRRPWGRLDFGQPLLRWLAWDGWGFHQAFFRPQRVIGRQQIERAARNEVRAIRDQGVGRALWFYAGADPRRIAILIAALPPERRCDFWAGIGLAASYTGAQPPERLGDLLRAADVYRDHVGQGAAFAAKAHVLSGAVPPRAVAAIELLAGAQPEVAAAWTDRCLVAAARGPDSPRTYQEWRAGIRDAWMRHNGGVFR